VVFLSGPSLPVIGDIMSHAVSPILARLMRPFFMRKMFGPAPVPRKFDEFPKEMALRPSQIRASAAETALMIPDAVALRSRYADLKMPVVIIAGEEDRRRAFTGTSRKARCTECQAPAIWCIKQLRTR
jgi:hypothetical protein